MDICKQVGRNIRHFREAKGWSQEQLAFEAGLHRTYISGVERGVRGLDHAGVVAQIKIIIAAKGQQRPALAGHMDRVCAVGCGQRAPQPVSLKRLQPGAQNIIKRICHEAAETIGLFACAKAFLTCLRRSLLWRESKHFKRKGAP